ncbi:MAG: glutamate--cysteine ligase [Planctomycetota bacterium]
MEPADADERPLLKGLEEEVYVGTADADIVPLSHRIAADLCGFVTEPDARNVEYTTAPYRSYRTMLDRLMTQRCRLRRYVQELGGYTLIPGSTLSLVEGDEFVISNPKNPYYRYIQDTYGTTVVTASTHINVGVPDPELLIRAYRLLRAEASMYLALTANSPFLRGRPTGAHSTRWRVFPPTPAVTPFFVDHAHFRRWVAAQLEQGVMFNPRHLWLSIRPNGQGTPEVLERLELRICDRIAKPRDIGAVVALMEARVRQSMTDPELDPLTLRSEAELQRLCVENERRAAESSLDATVIDWRTGDEVPMRGWIEACHRACAPVAEQHGFGAFLAPLADLLAEGNLAQQWLAQVAAGRTPREVLRQAIVDLTEIDRRYDPECPAASSAPPPEGT